MCPILLETALPELKMAGRGKVRDIYDLGDRLLIVASDRISAFDCILPTGIPDKGRVLTSMSRFWFGMMRDIVPNHLDEVSSDTIPPSIQAEWPAIAGRSMIVRRATPFPVECVARGYLSGSAWKEYRDNCAAGRYQEDRVPCAGVLLPRGLVESSQLPEPIFTPATKAETGHDENISFATMQSLVGSNIAAALRDYTLKIYRRAADYAADRGIIIADTKLEFGAVPPSDDIILIDEVLTPDSSRFWDASAYVPGRPQPSYDKQFVRDYLETLEWDKTPPAPPLPPDVVARTTEKYREAHRRLTGSDLPERDRE